MGQPRISELFCGELMTNKKKALQKAISKGKVSDVQFILSDRSRFGLSFWCDHLPDDLGEMLHITTNAKIGKLLLSYGAKVDMRNRRNETPLMTTVRRRSGDYLHYVALLMEHGADIHAKNSDGQTALICAVLNCNYNSEVVKSLLRHGSNANLYGKDGYTALMTVVCHRDSKRKYFENKDKVLKRLSLEVSRGTNSCSHAYKIAKWSGNSQADVVRELLYHGASVNICHCEHGTALHMALRNLELNPEVIDLFLNHGGNLRSASNVFQDTPLHAAAGNRYMTAEVVLKLIRLGAIVNSKNIKGNTPLHTAVEKYDNVEIIAALMSGGADVNARNKYQNTPLHLAVRHSSRGVRELLKDPSIILNAKNRDRDTPLMILAQESNCDVSVINHLVSAGAEINETNKFRETALHKALKKGNWNWRTFYDPAKILQYKSLNVMVDYINASIENAHIGIEFILGQLEIVDSFSLLRRLEMRLKTIKELIKCGSNIFAVDLNHKSPLRIVCSMFPMDHRGCGRMVMKYCMLHYPYDRMESFGSEVWKCLRCHKGMTEFYKACMVEVVRMSRDDITDNISLYDYLNKEKLTLDKRFIIDENIYDISDMIFEKVLTRQYPIYNNVLCENLDRSYLEEKFVESNFYVKVELTQGREIILDAYSMRAIAKYVPTFDLAKFVLSFADSDFSIEKPFDVLPKEQFAIPVTCCAKHKLYYMEK